MLVQDIQLPPSCMRALEDNIVLGLSFFPMPCTRKVASLWPSISEMSSPGWIPRTDALHSAIAERGADNLADKAAMQDVWGAMQLTRAISQLVPGWAGPARRRYVEAVQYYVHTMWGGARPRYKRFLGEMCALTGIVAPAQAGGHVEGLASSDEA
jgi:hypothetical protein